VGHSEIRVNLGFATGTTGVNFGVSGASSSNSGVGVSGEGGTGIMGVGYNVGGSFTLANKTGYILQGKNSSGTTLFYVDSGGNQATGGNFFANGYIAANASVTARGNGQSAIIGDPGCGAGYAGIGFSALSGCNNYSMIGNGADTFLNRPSGGYMHFRENNAGGNGAPDQVLIAPGGAVGLGISSPRAHLDVSGGGGTSGYGVLVDNNVSQARAMGGWVKAMAYVDPYAPGGTAVTRCFNSQIVDYLSSQAPCGINYALRGDSFGNLYINSNSTGWMFFDNNNTGLMSLDPSGNLSIKGNISKGGGSFKIDHPLDPANKYLYHSFVESPDMMNIYNGNVVTDARGRATITLPDYFEALNRDFRYQLTVVGQFAQAIVLHKVQSNHFTIKTNKPGVEVSWQITGVRQDAWANAHRIPNEVDKPASERGTYLHPELYSPGLGQSPQ
jgi:hypothetical protein